MLYEVITAWWIVDTGASKTVFDRNQEQYFSLVENTSRQQYQSAGINEGRNNFV